MDTVSHRAADGVQLRTFAFDKDLHAVRALLGALRSWRAVLSIR
jgi:hypothetical protein